MPAIICTPKSLLYVRGIPKDLKRQFKTLCAGQGISMTGAITAFIHDVVVNKRTLLRRGTSMESSEPIQ